MQRTGSTSARPGGDCRPSRGGWRRVLTYLGPAAGRVRRLDAHRKRPALASTLNRWVCRATLWQPCRLGVSFPTTSREVSTPLDLLEVRAVSFGRRSTGVLRVLGGCHLCWRTRPLLLQRRCRLPVRNAAQALRPVPGVRRPRVPQAAPERPPRPLRHCPVCGRYLELTDVGSIPVHDYSSGECPGSPETTDLTWSMSAQAEQVSAVQPAVLVHASKVVLRWYARE